MNIPVVWSENKAFARQAAAPGVIGVDMPLGLGERGWRQADRLTAARYSYGDLDVPVGLFAPAAGGGRAGPPATRSCPGASLWWQDRLGGRPPRRR
jgi:Protein of unknown function (DUF429)